MTPADTLRGLIARVEQAEGADREVDAEIWCGIRGYVSYGQTGGIWGYEIPGLGIGSTDARSIPAYTTSLDDAVSLVPSGWGWAIKAKMEGAEFSASCWVYLTGLGPNTLGDTPALALTAAALRARLAMMEDGA